MKRVTPDADWKVWTFSISSHDVYVLTAKSRRRAFIGLPSGMSRKVVDKLFSELKRLGLVSPVNSEYTTVDGVSWDRVGKLATTKWLALPYDFSVIPSSP